MSSGNEHSDAKLWATFGGLDDDLLDPDYPDVLVDEQLRALGVDTVALDRRSLDVVKRAKDHARLSWQTAARLRQENLGAAMSKRLAREQVATLDRAAVLKRLATIREEDARLGKALRVAARKRKEEESTDEELRMLLVEMIALRSLETDDSD